MDVVPGGNDNTTQHSGWLFLYSFFAEILGVDVALSLVAHGNSFFLRLCVTATNISCFITNRGGVGVSPTDLTTLHY